MSLGQIKTETKSNEITAIPKLLDLLEIKGCIITIDAMGCQVKIAKKISDKQADYVLAVKDNQKHLHVAITHYFKTTLSTEKPKLSQVEKIEQTDAGHGRIETRRCYLLKLRSCFFFVYIDHICQKNHNYATVFDLWGTKT